VILFTTGNQENNMLNIKIVIISIRGLVSSGAIVALPGNRSSRTSGPAHRWDWYDWQHKYQMTGDYPHCGRL